MMPGLDGFEVLKILREHHAATDLPVIMATAKDDSEDVIHALGLGANDYVTKPLDFPVVVARIQTQISLKRAVEQVRQLERRLAERNRDLEAANARMSRDLRAAARIQESLLPRSSPDVPGLGFAWAFRPCDELAGDGLSAIKLDDHRVALYVLDVSGHGVASAPDVGEPGPAALAPFGRLVDPGPGRRRGRPARPARPGRGRRPAQPAVPVRGLDRAILRPWSTASWTPRPGEFRYTLAGHPGPIHLPADGPAKVLPGRGYPIGLADGPRPV